MRIFLKEMRSIGRSMYLYYPPGPRRTAFRRCAITVLRGDDALDSVHELLEAGLSSLADQEQIILCFPNPENGHWNSDFQGDQDDLAALQAMQGAMDRTDDTPLEMGYGGIPTLEAMSNAWHPMNDAKYLIGTGSGAHMALTFAACAPQQLAGVWSIGGVLCPDARARALPAPMPVVLHGSDRETQAHFVSVNRAERIDHGHDSSHLVYANAANPLQRVVCDPSDGRFSGEALHTVWDEVFSRVRRTNTGAYGDVEPRMDLERAGFEIFLDDDQLEKKRKTKHTWFLHIPYSIKRNTQKIPLMLFFHGGSDNPEEAADVSKFHELGEREGFITVYPWATNRIAWNSDMQPDQPDDVGFIVSLIRYLCTHFPVDPTRVYLSGFSNGAAHAQTVAMVHPELVAAICPIDSNWPGSRTGPTRVDYQQVVPMRLGLEKKQRQDYRMPVWYTYGTRELSYPVYRGCTQQHQYDFWKQYNNIEIRETPEQDHPHPCGCGVPGQVHEVLHPSARHAHHAYEVHRFYSRDAEPLNLYNYVMMRDKGHEVAQMDPTLGWQYVRCFQRMPDGSLRYTPQDTQSSFPCS